MRNAGRENAEESKTVVWDEGKATGKRGDFVIGAHEDWAWPSTRFFRDEESGVMRQL
jgi:hypothetical protein